MEVPILGCDGFPLARYGNRQACQPAGMALTVERQRRRSKPPVIAEEGLQFRPGIAVSDAAEPYRQVRFAPSGK